MLQLTPQTRIFLATEPVDFRKGIDGLGAVWVVYLALADIVSGPLASRLSDVQQPVIMTPNRFSTLRLHLLADI
jgi:hypothetical protein